MFFSFRSSFPELSKRYGSRYPYWCILCLAPMIIATVFATTSVNMAAHSIESEFHLGSGASAPLMTWFLIATAIAMAFSGLLISKIGHLQTLLIACGMFILSSGAIAAGDSLLELSCWRFVQGISTGLLQPLAMIIGKKAAPAHRLGFFIGIFGAITALAGALVPYVSGVIVDTGGWRVLFLVGIPPVLFGALASLLMISGSDTNTNDPNPGLSTLLRDPEFFRPFIIMFLFGMGFFGSIYLIPLFLQQVNSLSTTEAGVLMLPGNFILAAAFPLFGWMSTHNSPRLLVCLGLSIFSLGSLGWLFADANSNLFILILLIAIGRLGLGMIMPVVNLIAIDNRDGHSLNQASALMSLARMLGGATGVFLCGLVLQWGTAADQTTEATFHLSFVLLTIVFFIAFLPTWRIATRPFAKAPAL